MVAAFEGVYYLAGYPNSDFGPPPLFAAQLKHADPYDEGINDTLTAVLLDRFPIGTPEKQLLVAVQAQKFYFPRDQDYGCPILNSAGLADPSSILCDPKKTLAFDLGCDAVHVHWRTNERDEISELKADYIPPGFCDPLHDSFWYWDRLFIRDG